MFHGFGVQGNRIYTSHLHIVFGILSMPTAQKVVGALVHGDHNRFTQVLVDYFTWTGVDLASVKGKTRSKTSWSRTQNARKKDRETVWVLRKIQFKEEPLHISSIPIWSSYIAWPHHLIFDLCDMLTFDSFKPIKCPRINLCICTEVGASSSWICMVWFVG